MNDIALTPPVGNLTGWAHPVQAPAERAGETFGQLLQSALGRVGELQAEADRAVEDLTLGRSEDIHATMIA